MVYCLLQKLNFKITAEERHTSSSCPKSSLNKAYALSIVALVNKVSIRRQETLWQRWNRVRIFDPGPDPMVFDPVTRPGL